MIESDRLWLYPISGKEMVQLIENEQDAKSIPRAATDDFDVKDCFDVLRAVPQTVYPTVVSMVFDVQERTDRWCENRMWDAIQTVKLASKKDL